MSARQRRRPMVRTPPTGSVGLDQIVTVAADASPDAGSQQAELGVEQKRLLKEFEAALSEQSSLDREDRDFIFEQYKAAIENASIESKLTPDVDRATWIETAELLSRDQEIERTDIDALIRQFDEAMQPLQSPRVQVALEYVQRLQQYGEANAMEWLQGQHNNQEQDAASKIVPSTPDAILRRQSITQSKSRRLRGPPTKG